MRVLTPTLFLIFLDILLIIGSVERIFNESRLLRTSENYLRSTSKARNIRTEPFSEPLSLIVPAKGSHPFISLESISPIVNMKLVAGKSTAGYSGDGGPATSAQLRLAAGNPWVDSLGNIYLPDQSNNRIRKIDTVGTITTFGGTGGASSTVGTSDQINVVSFNQPNCIVGDTGGTYLYISDEWYVWKYLFATNIVSVFAHNTGLSKGLSGDGGPASLAQLAAPTGLWLTTSGVLYISDANNHRIRRVSSDIITTVAGSGCSFSCVGSFSGDNGPATSATLYSPYGIYMDTNGKLYIADNSNHRIRLINSNNIITTFAGSGTYTPFSGDNLPKLSINLDNPVAVQGDSLGNIYVADTDHCIIRMIDTTGVAWIIFGNPGNSCGFSPGVTSRSSSINTPYGFWLDTLSNLYFSDYYSVHRSIELYPTSQPSRQPTSQPTSTPTSFLLHLFDFSPNMQNVTVPLFVNFMQVDITGGAGGNYHGHARPGYGARVQATIPVIPGTVLYVMVGGKGGLTFDGSYNGGRGCGGNNGGGASDIRIGGMALTNRIVVAGGGGAEGAGDSGGGCALCGPLQGGDAGLVGNAGASGCTTAGGGGGLANSGGVAGGSGGHQGTLGNGGGPGDCCGGGGGGGYYGGK
jgi:hypothetical protein